MRISKCDICKKIINREKTEICLSGEGYQKFDFCFTCADPIMKFLKAKKLITQDKKY